MSISVDEGQVFNAKLKELESAIELIEGIGIDLSKIKEQKKIIEEDVNSEINKTYEMYKTNNYLEMRNSQLDGVYRKGTAKLKSLLNIVKDYNDFLSIVAKYNTLKLDLNHFKNNVIGKYDSKIIKQKINNLVYQIEQLLIAIKATNSTDYKNEEKIIEAIYNSAYTILKFELLYYGESNLLNSIKSDSVDAPNIAKLVKENIIELDNIKINEAYDRIRTSVDSKVLLNDELIKLIAYYELEEDVIKQLEFDMSEISSIADEIQSSNNNVTSLTCFSNNLSYDKKEIIKKKISFYSLCSLTAIAFTSIMLYTYGIGIKKGYDVTTYKHTVESYNSSTGETNISEFYDTKDKTDLTCYQMRPWERTNEKGYTREMYKIPLSDSYIDNTFEEILDDVKDTAYQNFYKTTNTSSTMPDDFDVLEDTYIIEKTKCDKNVSCIEHKFIDSKMFTIACIAAAFNIMLVNTALYFIFKSKKSLKTIKSDLEKVKLKIELLKKNLERLNDNKDDLTAFSKLFATSDIPLFEKIKEENPELATELNKYKKRTK